MPVHAVRVAMQWRGPAPGQLQLGDLSMGLSGTGPAAGCSCHTQASGDFGPGPAQQANPRTSPRLPLPVAPTGSCRLAANSPVTRRPQATFPGSEAGPEAASMPLPAPVRAAFLVAPGCPAPGHPSRVNVTVAVSMPVQARRCLQGAWCLGQPALPRKLLVVVRILMCLLEA